MKADLVNAAVVGASGFLGQAIVKKLLSENFSVTAVYNKNFTEAKDISVQYITDFLETKNNFDYIFLSLGSFASTHSELVEINKIIGKIVTNNPRSKIIFVSTTNIYGVHQSKISLYSSFNNPGLYALSKLAGEFIVSSHPQFSILRLTYLYGKGLNNKSFLPNIIEKSTIEKEIVLFGDGSRVQDYLHVSDAASLCFKAAISKENGIYLGASGISTSNLEIAEIIAKHNDAKINLQGVESGASFNFDIKDVMDRLKWKPQIDIKMHLNEML